MITDFYMGCTLAGPIHCNSRGQWDSKLRSLQIGESFTVDTEDERSLILKRASKMGIMVSTGKLTKGGYSIRRLADDTPPRKRGQPKIWPDDL